MPRMKTSKSEKIRQMLREMGMDASPTEISRKLTGRGVKVTPNLVSGIKISMKHKKRTNGRGGRRHRSAVEGQPSIDEVYMVWELAHRIGNAKLKQIVRKMPV
jgi:hypothetical protein